MALEVSNKMKCIDSEDVSCVSESKDKRIYEYDDNVEMFEKMIENHPVSDKCDEVIDSLNKVVDSDNCLLEEGVKKAVGCISSQFRKGDMDFKESMNRAWQLVKDLECV